MALKRYQDTFGSVQPDGDVFVLAGASVEVRDETSGALAAIFEDRAGNTAKSNPFTTDSVGYGFFYAANGRYRITATLGGETVDLRDVGVGFVDFGDGPVSTLTGSQTLETALDDRSVIITSGLTVNIPTDYATLQAAIDDLSTRSIKQGVVITLNIESGHQPTAGVSLTDGDYGHFTITSVDAEVTLDPSWPSGTDFIACTNGRAPVLDCLVNSNGLARYGVNCQQGAYITVNPGCGVKNTTDRGIYLNSLSSSLASSSIFTGVGSVVTGSGMRGAWVARGSTLIAEDADFSNAGGVGIYVSRASTVHAMGVKAENCGAEAVWVHRASRLTAHSVVGFNVSLSTNSAFDAVKFERGSTGAINADAGGSVTITQNGTGNGVNVGGSVLDCRSATINGGSSSATGINSTGGARVSASNANVDGFNNNILANGGTVDAALITSTGARNNGAWARRGDVNIAAGSVTGSTSADLVISDGAFMRADGCSTTSSSGTPALSDSSVGSFNSLSAQGVIFT